MVHATAPCNPTPYLIEPMNDLLKQLDELIALRTHAKSGPWTYYTNGNTVQSHAIAGVCSNISPLSGNAAFIAAAGSLDFAALRAALTPAAAAVSAAGAAGWVSVTDRLPETRDDYSRLLLCYGEGGIDGPWFVAYYCASMGTWYLARDNQPRMTVTHWQPRPAAPAPAA